MAFPPKKKPSLAEVTAKLPVADEDEDGDMDGYAASVDELADVLGVADDKRDTFRSAFEAAVMSCK